MKTIKVQLEVVAMSNFCIHTPATMWKKFPTITSPSSLNILSFSFLHLLLQLLRFPLFSIIFRFFSSCLFFFCFLFGGLFLSIEQFYCDICVCGARQGEKCTKAQWQNQKFDRKLAILLYLCNPRNGTTIE